MGSKIVWYMAPLYKAVQNPGLQDQTPGLGKNCLELGLELQGWEDSSSESLRTMGRHLGP